MLAATACLALPAAAQHTVKYYGSVHGGQNNLQEWDASVNFGGGTNSIGGQLKLERALHWGVIGGREEGPNRLEIEYQRGTARINQVTLGSITQGAGRSGHYQALTLNGLRSFELTNEVNAFVGLGIGWGSVSLPGLDPINGCNCFSPASEGGLAIQARVGAEYEIGVDRHLGLQYTWLRLPAAAASATPTVRYSRKVIGAWTVGYRGVF